MSASPLPELGVVIVNWNTAHLLAECLQSIATETESITTEIVVVDNGSSDESLDLLAGYPAIRVISLPENVGYQAACNIGSRACTAPTLLHINSDARLSNGALKAMLEVLRDKPEVGIVGPRLVYGDGSFQRWTAGRLPSMGSLAHSFLLGDRLPGRGVWIEADRLEGSLVGWVSSACLVVRADAFNAIDGLDEQFFAYMDDVDLCHRAGEHGWLTWYEPSATAVHFMGGSQQRTVGVSATAIRSMSAWFRSRKGPVAAAGAASIMSLGFAARAVAHLVIRRDTPTAAAHFTSARIALASGVPS